MRNNRPWWIAAGILAIAIIIFFSHNGDVKTSPTDSIGAVGNVSVSNNVNKEPFNMDKARVKKYVIKKYGDNCVDLTVNLEGINGNNDSGWHQIVNVRAKKFKYGEQAIVASNGHYYDGFYDDNVVDIVDVSGTIDDSIELSDDSEFSTIDITCDFYEVKLLHEGHVDNLTLPITALKRNK